MWYWLDWLRSTGKGSDFFIADRPDLNRKHSVSDQRHHRLYDEDERR